MASALLGGAALGAVFGELLNLVIDTTKKAVAFEDDLKRLVTTLNSITPLMEVIEELNVELDYPMRELDLLKEEFNEGKKLVSECSKAKKWSTLYSGKLVDLDVAIRGFSDRITNALQTKGILKLLVTARSNSNSGVVLGSCAVPEPPAFTVGLDVPLKELKMRLLNDDQQVLVLSAPGGCGKTTLVKKFGHDDEVKGEFGKNIFFVTFSKTPNLKGIIQSMFQHKGYQVPEFQSDEHAVHQLEQFLRAIIRRGPVLLVLDDVWSGSESLVEKFVFNIPKYKILVTSRSEIPRFKTYNLKLLNDEDAMTLFRQSAFQQNGSSDDVPGDLVNKIVKKCNGFPLALEVVGNSLRGQPPFIWQSTVTKWSKQSIYASENDIRSCLQTSFDALDDKLKECFMDLGSFPEDQRIPAAALIDMWVELYELDEDDVSAMDNLHQLSTRNLVNLLGTRKDASEVDVFYNEQFVTQHDLLRELAIHQINLDPIEQRERLIIDGGENHPPSTEPKQQPISARLLSRLKCSTERKQQLIRARNSSLDLFWFGVVFPLVLVLGFFFGVFPLGLSFLWLFCILCCFCFLILLVCSSEKKKLIRARLLSISGYSTDEMISSSCSNMKLPDVEVLLLNIGTENYTLPKFITKTKKLKVLIVKNNGFSPPELSNFSLLGSLSNIKRIRLENISIPSLGNIQLKKLRKISFIMCRMGQAFRNCTIQLSDMLPKLVEINIDYCNDLVELPGSLCDIVHLKKLSITNCHKLSELPERIGSLANLEVLRLRACTELLELPGSIGSLHKLSSLDISDCVSMKRMPEQMGQWCNLRKLDMRGCSSLSELPPSIKDLEHLERVFCDEEISTLWESFGLSNLKIHVLEEDVNLNWLPNLKV